MCKESLPKFVAQILLTLHFASPILGQSNELFRCIFSERSQDNTINFSVDKRDDTSIDVTSYPGSDESMGLSGAYRYYTRESIPNYQLPTEPLTQLTLKPDDIVGVTFYALKAYPLFDSADLDLKILFTQGENDQKLYAGAYGNYLGEKIHCLK